MKNFWRLHILRVGKNETHVIFYLFLVMNNNNNNNFIASIAHDT